MVTGQVVGAIILRIIIIIIYYGGEGGRSLVVKKPRVVFLFVEMPINHRISTISLPSNSKSLPSIYIHS